MRVVLHAAAVLRTRRAAARWSNRRHRRGERSLFNNCRRTSTRRARRRGSRTRAASRTAAADHRLNHRRAEHRCCRRSKTNDGPLHRCKAGDPWRGWRKVNGLHSRRWSKAHRLDDRRGGETDRLHCRYRSKRDRLRLHPRSAANAPAVHAHAVKHPPWIPVVANGLSHDDRRRNDRRKRHGRLRLSDHWRENGLCSASGALRLYRRRAAGPSQRGKSRNASEGA